MVPKDAHVINENCVHGQSVNNSGVLTNATVMTKKTENTYSDKKDTIKKKK